MLLLVVKVVVGVDVAVMVPEVVPLVDLVDVALVVGDVVREDVRLDVGVVVLDVVGDEVRELVRVVVALDVTVVVNVPVRSKILNMARTGLLYSTV